MKQYLSALIQKIGRLNVSIYLLLLSVGYGLYSILPYTLPKIFSGSGGLHVNPFFMVLSILSFLVVPILNYPNNLAMQSVRKYSKQVLFDDLVKKKYSMVDSFMKSVSATPIALFVVSLVMSLLCMNDVIEKKDR